jgi:hypothetical protein
LLFDQTILDNIFSYPANSKTALTEDPALRPVPAFAGNSFTKHDLYFVLVIYGTVLSFVKGTTYIFLYASREALDTAIETSAPFATQSHIFPFLFPTKIVALNDILLPHVVTLVTLLTSSNNSSNSFFVLSLLPPLISTINYIINKQQLQSYSTCSQTFYKRFYSSMVKVSISIKNNFFNLFILNCFC